MAIVYIAIFTFLRCTVTSEEPRLIKTTQISEQEGVIHHLPFDLTQFSDSLFGCCLGQRLYSIYNVYTGQLIKKITVDTSKIKELVAFANNITKGNYELIPQEELLSNGIEPYEIQNACCYNDTTYLFFYAICVVRSTSIAGKDTTEKNSYEKLPFIAIISNNGVKYSFIETGENDPFFLLGVQQYKNKFFVFDDPYIPKKDTTSIVYLTLNGDHSNIYATKIRFAPIKATEIPELQNISYSLNEKGELIICDEKYLYDLNGSILHKVFNRADSLKINEMRYYPSGYSFYVKNNNSDCFLYSYSNERPSLIQKFDYPGTAIFTNKNELVRFVKKNNAFYFEIYKI